MSSGTVIPHTPAMPPDPITGDRAGPWLRLWWAGLWRRRIGCEWLIALLIGWLGLDVLLLWRFLGIGAWWSYVAGAIAVVVLMTGSVGAVRGCGRSRVDGPDLATLSICAAIAALLLLLGGEGRLFYANIDWMVRDGVLHDMGTHPWPYAYMARGVPEVLRAPIGMYLVPALALKAGGQAMADGALLLQNAFLLTVLLGLGSVLFPSARHRAVALAVFIFFSGLDVAGAMLSPLRSAGALPDHLEWWVPAMQFSSHITQLFWVPQHALAGWACAVGFMLWRDDRLSLGGFLALVPMTILWSPLSALGAMPFAAFAIGKAWRQRAIQPYDIALPMIATLLSVPTLLYLSAAGQSVGARSVGIDPVAYFSFEFYEVMPFLAIAIITPVALRFGKGSALLCFAILLVLPLLQVGRSADLMMRASIPALAILSVMIAHILIMDGDRFRRAALLAILAIGSVTGLHELRRALIWPSSPPPLCSFFGAWGPSPAWHKSTYLAPVDALPPLIRPTSVKRVPPGDPAVCWARSWPKPSGI